ncbi:MAG: carboxypeptidase-like regulatory domain-containing protein [Prolixibacteraceae bacterium]|jgi:hypothetical protein
MKKSNDLLCFATRRWKKLIRAMKLTTLFVLITIFTTSAGNSYSQSTRINLKMRDATLVDIFRQIERTSDFGFFFKNEELDLNRRVSIDLKNATIDEILKRILVDNYTYRILDKNIVITKSNFNSAGQQIKSVSGNVTDTFGNPIPGVTVLLKNTTNGSITDGSGKYVISSVPTDGILVFLL